MTHACNYFYIVMPFALKNAGATYQRLMDRVFQNHISKNLEVYVDDLVVKAEEGKEHIDNLEDIFFLYPETQHETESNQMFFWCENKEVPWFHSDQQSRRNKP